uniref:Serine-threonine/tyrosine-protein kinase catalytic domain-containing protein n=1 Tax=Oryza glaberrima TaxID=4538 RepID=I1NSP8_ORYGL
MTQQSSQKSELYSFGSVMIELLSRRLPLAKGRFIDQGWQ